MCDCFIHSHYWEDEGKYKVGLDFEYNSHEDSKKKRGLPAEAVRCGIDPVNGEPVTNSGEPLPLMVKDKLFTAFQVNFPDIESIIVWIENNYNKYGDGIQWQTRLPKMLSEEGKRKLFSKTYCRHKAEYWQREAEYCQREAENYRREAENCQRVADDWQREAEYCQRVAEYWQRVADDWQRAIEDYQDKALIDGNNDPCWLSKFISVFRQYPNDYWSGKLTPKEVECKGYVVV